MYTAVPWLLPDPLIYYTVFFFAVSFADYSNQIEMVIIVSY
jgi:hypothetical protein